MQGSVRGFYVATLVAMAALSFGCERIVLNFESPNPESGSEGGQGGILSAAPGPPPAPEFVATGNTDFSVSSPSGRRCSDKGDMAAYVVETYADSSLVLTESPREECLMEGDEVLLIQLQASAGDTGRVGRHELLRVQRVEGPTVRLVAPPVLAYGDGSIAHWNAEGSRVVVQRVPHFSRMTVEADATLTAARWSDGGSGVFAVRVLGDLVVHGSIDMSEAGFSGGAERPEVLQHGLQGESITGPGIESTLANDGGGGGGLGDQMREACVQDGNAGGGGAHRENGDDATVDDLCDGDGRGRGGLAYAGNGRIYLGSGGGSGGVDNVRSDNPPGAPGGSGGGIIWLLAQSVTGSGAIAARGGDGVGDEIDVECLVGTSTEDCYDHSGPGGAGAGGTIKISATQVSGVSLDVEGGRGGNGYDAATGNGGDGSPGVIEAPRFD